MFKELCIGYTKKLTVEEQTQSGCESDVVSCKTVYEISEELREKVLEYIGGYQRLEIKDKRW